MKALQRLALACLVLVLPLCEDFLYGFKAAPRGRSRRRHGALAFAPAGAPAPAAPTLGRLARKIRNPGAAVN